MQTGLQRSRELFELEKLADLSARLGRNPLLVQAASGNTSVKVAEALWIKASGRWLADAHRQNIFIRVERAEFRTSAPCRRSTEERELRPSIETAMHVTMPHRVVVHVHSVNTIAWAVRRDGPEELTRRLTGLAWTWIPHCPSGRPLADEIAKALARAPRTDIFVLANHGLVVGAESCELAEALVGEVEARLAIVPRTPQRPRCPRLDQVACPSRWQLPLTDALHALGTDRISRSILYGGVLYPCQAIFLGPSLHILDHPAQIPSADQPFFILKDGGVIVHRNMTRAEYEMLLGLMEIVQRLDDGAPIRYLTQSEVTEVLSEDAYRYRALVEETTSCGY